MELQVHWDGNAGDIPAIGATAMAAAVTVAAFAGLG